MALLLPQQSEVLFAYSVLADLSPGYTTFNDHMAYYNAHGKAGYESALNSIFASSTSAQLGAALLANTGLSGSFTAAQAEAYIAANAANRAGAMINIANALYYYAGTDAALLAAHNAYLTRVDASYAYSATSNNTSSADLDGLSSTANTFTLTHSTDKATANIFDAPQVYTPGGDDRINSLQDEDTLTGSGTNPTLNATLGNVNDNGGPVITPALSGIATINTAFTGSAGVGAAVTVLDLQDATGLGTLNITRVSAATNSAEVANIMNALTLMTVTNSNSNQAGGVEISYNAGALAGANTGRLELKNVQVGTLNVGQNTSGVALAVVVGGVGGQGYENLTIASNGSPNAIGNVGLPMDTGTDGKITLEGAANLTLGTTFNIVNPGSGLAEAVGHNGGIYGNAGRLATVDASAMTGALSMNIGNTSVGATGGLILSTGKAGTSGAAQNVTVTGTKADDAFWLNDVVGAGDVINGSDGTDTLQIFAGGVTTGLASKIETVNVQMDDANVTLNFDNIADATLVGVRNASYTNATLKSADAGDWIATLSNLTAAQAGNLAVNHGTTFNNDMSGKDADLTVQALLKSDAGASDTVKVTINDGANADARFNFVLDNLVAATGVRQSIENVSFVDNDTESNSVMLLNFAKHTGTVTYSGGEAGDFFNLDLDTAGKDITTFINGTTADKGETQVGMLGLAVNHEYATNANAGNAADWAAGNTKDVMALATEVRLGAAKIDASAAVSNVVVRVSTNAASVLGAQEILMGTGNDTVIFDNLNDTRAGLTISDTVKGNTGTDTLAIDGNAVRINISASEWTNVSGFENLLLAGNAAVPVGSLYGQNGYNLTLTNDFITANGAGMINIINDGCTSDDAATVKGQAAGAWTAGADPANGATIDARTLDAAHHFSYNGQEGTWVDGAGGGSTVNGVWDLESSIFISEIDRFILADANVNGMNAIDGGAVDNFSWTWAANTDIMEVRNSSVVTVGDLANVRNIGIIAGSNDQAVVQTMVLQLNDSVIDAMADSYHTSTTTEQEMLAVRVGSTLEVTAPIAGTLIDFDGTQMTQRTSVGILLDMNLTPVGDVIRLGMGLVQVAGTFGAAGSFDTVGLTTVAPSADAIVMSAALFGIDPLAIGTQMIFSGGNIIFGALGTGAATDRVYVVQNASNVAGAAANDTQIYYDADGNGAGAAILVGVLVDAAAVSIAGAGNTGITVVA